MHGQKLFLESLLGGMGGGGWWVWNSNQLFHLYWGASNVPDTRGGHLWEFPSHKALTGKVLGGGQWLLRRGGHTWRFLTAFVTVLISVRVLAYLLLFFTVSFVFCCCFKVICCQVTSYINLSWQGHLKRSATFCYRNTSSIWPSLFSINHVSLWMILLFIFFFWYIYSRWHS